VTAAFWSCSVAPVHGGCLGLLDHATGIMLLGSCCWDHAAGIMLLGSCCWDQAAGIMLLGGQKPKIFWGCLGALLAVTLWLGPHPHAMGADNQCAVALGMRQLAIVHCS
jgi:hypothetical protein